MHQKHWKKPPLVLPELLTCTWSICCSGVTQCSLLELQLVLKSCFTQVGDIAMCAEVKTPPMHSNTTKLLAMAKQHTHASNSFCHMPRHTIICKSTRAGRTHVDMESRQHLTALMSLQPGCPHLIILVDCGWMISSLVLIVNTLLSKVCTTSSQPQSASLRLSRFWSNRSSPSRLKRACGFSSMTNTMSAATCPGLSSPATARVQQQC